MDGEAQARVWKDPDARDGAGDDHPSGALNIGSRLLTGIRSAVLAGVVVGFGALSEEGTLNPTSHPTVSAIFQ